MKYDSYQDVNPYAASNTMAAWAQVDERATFIRKTYLHLAGAIFLFALIEAFLLKAISPQAQDSLLGLMLGSRWSWLIVVGAFMGVSMLAQSWANSETSMAMQYMGLGLYTVAEALIIFPILTIATRMDIANGSAIVPMAAVATLGVFGGLTLLVFATKVDLTSWGAYLWWGGILAFGLAVAGMIFGFQLGLLYAGAMVALLSGYILYDTSNVIHRYRTTQHVAAALALFASVATLFFYILRILMELNRRD